MEGNGSMYRQVLRLWLATLVVGWLADNQLWHRLQVSA